MTPRSANYFLGEILGIVADRKASATFWLCTRHCPKFVVSDGLGLYQVHLKELCSDFDPSCGTAVAIFGCLQQGFSAYL